MSLTATAHVNFRGNARAALEFYAQVFGGQAAVATYADTHSAQDPADAEHVSFGQVTAPDGFAIMAYDVQSARPFSRGDNSFFIALRGPDAAQIQTRWDSLADGATIEEPLAPAPFSALYGKLTDRFGVTWILGVDAG